MEPKATGAYGAWWRPEFIMHSVICDYKLGYILRILQGI